MINIFGNFVITFVLLSVYALAMAIGTFIENDYGVMSARTLIYQSGWFEILHILLGLNLALIIYRYKMFKKEKLPQFIFHLAFLIILIGAGVTRYFGYEGMLHIREGKSENRMISSEPYLQILAISGDLKNQEKFEYLKRFSSTPFGWNY